ncbi:DUF2189 domain-containing protein [Qipengyuania sp. 1NDH17]|uniref:DUF2189 domain-containing protein n=1 Tax=Qipengyuania polymorpha TaxID=2867234 RepID=A0ABS7J1B5_9SPHN|nr:DUF2189 domain-containing protein [Qipengyuania polymorpha]MBX7458355.1 DUF2189 domain-containing protein [Qipengyuania polymorpha]
METQLGNGPAGIRGDLSATDLAKALRQGWRDFAARPQYGLFFASFYVAVGIGLYYLFMVRGETRWLIAAVAGFPLFAPFAAVGLYEVSRRLEQGLPMGWTHVLGALRGRGDEQLLLMGGIIFVGFSFWVIIAHMIFAIFASAAGLGEGMAFLTSQMGLTMLAVGGAIGAIIAFIFYAMTVMSLPMLVDRDVDFITAIITSFKALSANFAVLLLWAVMIAVALFAAILPYFLGLLVVLPVLGHATWHLYRRTVG